MDPTPVRPILEPGSPEEAGLDPMRLHDAAQFVNRWVADGSYPGVHLVVARRGVIPLSHCAGDMGTGPVNDNTLFLIASVTKTITATAVMLLVERGLMSLGEPVCRFLPEFSGEGRERVTVWHLLTHTSGLPEQPAENLDLRRAHRGLDAFVEAACRAPLAFAPGTRIAYSNPGFALLGEIVSRVAGIPFPVFVRDAIFAPLGMMQAHFVPPDPLLARVAHVRLPQGVEPTDYDLNSPYWRSIANPWGGLFATAHDLAILCQCFLNEGIYGSTRLLSAAAVRTMIAEHVGPDCVPADDTATPVSRGLGWDRRGRKHGTYFGDLTSSATYGHTGMTGTMIWADPERQLLCVFLSNQSGGNDNVRFGRLSNLVVGACV